MDSNYQQQAEHEQQQWLVYQKLQTARIKLQSMTLKKSGHNKFAGYQYFELGDFLPTINEIFHELGLCSVVSFTFSSPMAEAQLKGCHPIQNLGAVETYQRRYLYVTALEIVEHDALDATTGQDAPKASKAVTVDVFDSISKEEQDWLENTAMEVRLLIKKDDMQGALDFINMQQFDADLKTAFWSRLDSKERSAIKKFSVGK